MPELLNHQSPDNQRFATKRSQDLHLGNILQTSLKIIVNNEHIWGCCNLPAHFSQTEEEVKGNHLHMMD